MRVFILYTLLCPISTTSKNHVVKLHFFTREIGITWLGLDQRGRDRNDSSTVDAAVSNPTGCYVRVGTNLILLYVYVRIPHCSTCC